MKSFHSKAIGQVLAVVIVILIIAVAFVGYGVGTFGRAPQTTTITTQTTVTSTIKQTTTNGNQTVTVTTSTYCVQTGGGVLRVIVVQDTNGSPVGGVTISGAETDSCGTFSIGPVTTPTNGTVLLGDAGNLFLVANYAGHSYSFDAEVYPVTTTFVILSIPSGNVSTEYSQPFN